MPSFLFVPARLKWFENNQPETYSRIATVFTIADWIIYRLCGERVSEACGASELGLVDVRQRRWSDKLRDLLHLPCGVYPELSEAGRRAGEVTSRAAAESGIMAGTAVAVGAPDAQCGLIGLGVEEDYQAGVVAGWSAPVQIVTDEPIFDSEAKTWTSCHLLPQKWILESSAGEVGSAYRWLKETMFNGLAKEEAYGLMDSLAQQVTPGADGVLAFVGPAAMDMSHLGLKSGGFLFPVPFSVVNLQRAQIVRAVLENLCFAIKANCIQLETISGMKIKEVRIGGSLAKSQCLIETLAAVLDIPVTVPELTDVSGLGTAMCAAVGSGAYSSVEEAMTAMRPEARLIEPDRLAVLEYDEWYRRWTATADWLGKMSEEMQ
jgi:autoinducer 2 (AI-2) kinase